ncbi:MAG: DUF1080 domain-containing protein [Bacteroidales bacterium]|jgi:hypothetical protein|nr:DUF1080 domain-containing protein [Bacteroidales bacterium]
MGKPIFTLALLMLLPGFFALRHHLTECNENALPSLATSSHAGEGEWRSLFNGRNLDGRIPKVTGYEVGLNPLDGIRVENGILKFDYTKFENFITASAISFTRINFHLTS